MSEDRPTEPPAAVCFAMEVFGRKVLVPAADWLAMVRDVTAWNEAARHEWQRKGKRKAAERRGKQ